MSPANRILKFLTKQLLSRYPNLPVILVLGNVGKSSQTLLLNQVFEAQEYKVISGTSLSRGLNSLAGIGMSFLKVDFNLENSGPWAKFITASGFYFKLFVAGFLFPPKLNKKSILIYEIGYDTQGESQNFVDLFRRIDVLICTNIAWEHSGGFDGHNLDMATYNLLKPYLNQGLITEMEDPNISKLLKNIALEQLTLLPKKPKLVLIPQTIQTLTTSSNTVRSPNFGLTVGGVQMDRRYLLPMTFGVFIDNIIQVGQLFKLNPELINRSLSNFELPAGRFSRLTGRYNSTIIDSSYNSDPASVEKFLENLVEVIEYYRNSDNRETSRLTMPPTHTIILGEMRELGQISSKLHSQVLDQLIEISKKYSDYINEIILIGTSWHALDQDQILKINTVDRFRWIRYRQANWRVFDTAGAIKQNLNLDLIRPNSWFWVKGSQNTIFLELVSEHLLANPHDARLLCRRGPVWDKVRENWSS